MSCDTKKDYIIDNIDNLDMNEKKMVDSIFRIKYEDLLQCKSAGTAIDLDKVDSNTINKVYVYIKTTVDKKIKQFKN